MFAVNHTVTSDTIGEAELSPTAAAVLMYICLAESEGKRSPTREKIVVGLRFSDRSVGAALTELKRRAFIERVVAYESTERGRPAI